MTVRRSRRPRHAHALVVFASAAALLSSACGDPQSAATAKRERALATRSAAATVEAQAACGTGAHDKHSALGVSCVTCHPCGGIFGFGTVEYPGGTTTEGGQLTRNASGTTCSVGCHSPLGAPTNVVGWNDGPLLCSDCHSNVIPADVASIRSTHFVGLTDPSTVACASCHDNSQHTSGEVVIVGMEGLERRGRLRRVP